MPELSPLQHRQWSGNFNLYILIRNFSEVRDIISRQAYIAHQAGRPLEVAELTNNIPFASFDFLDPKGFRSQHGDALNYLRLDEKTPPIRLGEGNQPTTVTVFSNQDQTRNYLAGAPYLEEDDMGEIPKRLINNFSIFEKFTAEDWRNRNGPDVIQKLKSAYDKSQQDGALRLQAGNVVDGFRQSLASGKKFDFLVSMDFSQHKDRIQLLQDIQNSLHPKGQAVIPLTWWAPKVDGAGTEKFSLFADLFRSSPTGKAEPPPTHW